MLYKKNCEKTLSKELFENPTEEYRGTPFWSWNCKVTPELVKKQISYLKEMGFGGYHIHSRTGMDVEYLSDEFMDLIKLCAKEAKEKHMLAWLYDEDRYPSGAAGGLVTKDPVYRARYLKMTQHDERKGLKKKKEAIEAGEMYFYAAYDIVLNSEGELVSYRMTDPDKDRAEGTVWYAYICPLECSGWYNNLTYVDTLSKKAIDKFLEITHERYKEAVGECFDDTVPAIFTDEPQFSRKKTLSYANSDEEIIIPWTPDMDRLYRKRYGKEIGKTLPELFWERSDGVLSKARYLFHDFVCEVFTGAFSDNIGNWCKKNNIAFTGHVMGEQWLSTQTEHLGEAMRCYRGFDIPGIDMLCDEHEFITAKQCQSAVHQFGREGMLSELYGVTGWDYDFRGHKSQGDWQAALGVTVRVPHLSWMSMHGDAKRDYPASIFYQSPWYKEYPYIENHFARLNTALTRGKPIVDIAVIHPIESYWLHWGPKRNTAEIRCQLETNCQDVINWLLFSQLDFDFISESLLPKQYKKTKSGFKVGKMTYKALVVPGVETLRSSTLKILKEFRARGGKVIFMGDCPEYVDGELSADILPLYNSCENADFRKLSLLRTLENEREAEVRYSDGTRADCYLYNYRQDRDCRWFFLARGTRAGGKYGGGADLEIRIKGKFTPELYDTLTGKISVPEYKVMAGSTYIYVKAYEVDSFLFRLGAYDKSIKGEKAVEKTPFGSYINLENVKFGLSEENVMVLDEAEYRVDSPSAESEGGWQKKEELQRVHNICGKIAGLPKYNMTQPWADLPEKLEHTVDLKFEFESDIDYEKPCLALENAGLCTVLLNGVKAEGKPSGYFTDESIEKVALPPIRRGHNILIVRTPIGIRTKIEWCYLMGMFGVEIYGCEKKVTKLPEKIGFMSLNHQKMPFYTGNIDYTETIDVPENAEGVSVRVSEFTGALVKVFVDGEEKGIIAFDPFCADLGKISAGKHEVTFRLFGTRENSFGALHNADVNERWKGPNLWETTGNKWCYEYRLKPLGITSSPEFTYYMI